jgi:hypothetical protein
MEYTLEIKNAVFIFLKKFLFIIINKNVKRKLSKYTQRPAGSPAK